MSSTTRLCVSCKKTFKSMQFFGGHLCPSCGTTTLNMGTRWRAPRLTNRKAWRMIEAGDYLWDKKAIKPKIVAWETAHPNHNKKNRKSKLFGLVDPWRKTGPLGHLDRKRILGD